MLANRILTCLLCSSTVSVSPSLIPTTCTESAENGRQRSAKPNVARLVTRRKFLAYGRIYWNDVLVAARSTSLVTA